MNWLAQSVRRLVQWLANWVKAKPRVRPWALSAPVLVLLIALPLLRPLRHPGSWSVSADELARLATISAIVERGTLAIDDTISLAHQPVVSQRLIRFNSRLYSDQPPMLALILAGPYWLLCKMGLTLARAPSLAPYLLTLIGSTIPASIAAAMVYKMARLFELRRPWRALLAMIIALASGLISYATVLSACVPAGVLVLGSAGALLYVSAARRSGGKFIWFALAGALAMLAGAIDPAAWVFFPMLLAVIGFFPWSRGRRLACAALYLGAAIPLLFIYFWLNVQVTGDLRPPTAHPELSLSTADAPQASVDDAADDEPAGWFSSLLHLVSSATSPLLGAHGVLTHCPAVIIACLGAVAVIRRHWPSVGKVLAAVSLVGTVMLISGICPASTEPTRAAFANPRLLIALPLMLFWTGAWLRQRHSRWPWLLTSIAVGCSLVISLLGATDPMPQQGYDGYTAAQAAGKLVWSHRASHGDSLIMETP